MARLEASEALRASLLFWSISGLVLSEAVAVVIALLHGRTALLGATLVTFAWWVLIAAVFFGGASMLATPDGRAVDRYGVPNGLTALRAWLCVPLMLIAVLSLPERLALALWVGAGGVVGLLDAADGIIARRIGPVTVLGKALDPFMDALFFPFAALGSYLLGIVPAWLAGLIAFRFAAPLLATPIVFLARRRPELVHTSWGRRNTLLIGVVLFTLFWVKLVGGPVWVAALLAGIPTLVPTTMLHFVALAQRVARAPIVSTSTSGATLGQPPG